MPPTRIPRTMVRVEAAGQIYEQVQPFAYIRAVVAETPDICPFISPGELAHAGCASGDTSVSSYNKPKVALSLKTQMVKAEAIETLLYGCSTWAFRHEYYAKFRTVHHWVLLRTIGAQCKRQVHWMVSHNRALKIARCESIETTLRTRVFLAGALIRMSGARLPKRFVFGNIEGAVQRGRGWNEKEWTVAYRTTSGYLE